MPHTFVLPPCRCRYGCRLLLFAARRLLPIVCRPLFAAASRAALVVLDLPAVPSSLPPKGLPSGVDASDVAQAARRVCAIVGKVIKVRTTPRTARPSRPGTPPFRFLPP